MEEIKAYIETGILELYVMGDLNPLEIREVEAMVSKHPELKAEIAAIEDALERYALANAVAPKAELRNGILDAVFSETDASTVDNSPKETESIKAEPVEAKVLPIKQAGTGFYRIAIAACIGLLIISCGALLNVYNKLSNAKGQIANLMIEKQQFAGKSNYMGAKNAQLESVVGMINNPDWSIVKLNPMKAPKPSKLLVLWNKKQQKVMIDCASMALPENDKQHQYQLWAIVSGKPVDLGVFDMNPDSTTMMLNMKPIANAQVFAVTLEPRGGSGSPNMDQMMVMAKI